MKIYELAKEGKYEEARRIYEEILPILLYQEKDGNTEPGLCKYCLNLQGFDCGVPRKPVPEVSEEAKRTAEKLLKKAENVKC